MTYFVIGILIFIGWDRLTGYWATNALESARQTMVAAWRSARNYGERPPSPPLLEPSRWGGKYTYTKLSAWPNDGRLKPMGEGVGDSELHSELWREHGTG